eukprot:1148631-Pelagomonas_calceolata.AAC.9
MLHNRAQSALPDWKSGHAPAPAVLLAAHPTDAHPTASLRCQTTEHRVPSLIETQGLPATAHSAAAHPSAPSVPDLALQAPAAPSPCSFFMCSGCSCPLCSSP